MHIFNKRTALFTAAISLGVLTLTAAHAQNAPSAAEKTAQASALNASNGDIDIPNLIQQNKLDLALSKIDTALLSKSDDIGLNFQKGVVLSLLGKVDDAIKVFTQMTETHPNIAEPYNNLAILYITKKDYLRARGSLEMAVQNRPDYANAYDNLGDLYVKLAATAYEQNLKIDSNNMIVRSKLDLIAPINVLPVGARKAITKDVQATNATAAAMPSTQKNVEKNSDEKAINKTAPASTTTPAKQAVEKTAEKPEKSEHAVQAKDESKNIAMLVSQWAKAWSGQQVGTYLSYYSPNFQPANQLSYADWKQDRREKISNKNAISVTVSSLKIRVNKNLAVAKFTQIYQADSLKETSKKTLVLTQQTGKWLIAKELSE